jgi:uncharacterized membrane protein YhhN
MVEALSSKLKKNFNQLYIVRLALFLLSKILFNIYINSQISGRFLTPLNFSSALSINIKKGKKID